MSTHSVADAKNNLSDLIDRALNGEGVTITRHGTPVVELTPCQAPAKPIGAVELDWLAARRLYPKKPAMLESGALVSAMRDEDGH